MSLICTQKTPWNDINRDFSKDGNYPCARFSPNRECSVICDSLKQEFTFITSSVSSTSFPPPPPLHEPPPPLIQRKHAVWVWGAGAQGSSHNTGLCSKYTNHVELFYFYFLFLLVFGALANNGRNKVATVAQLLPLAVIKGTRGEMGSDGAHVCSLMNHKHLKQTNSHLDLSNYYLNIKGSNKPVFFSFSS